ncbi:MAG: hypothetical protein EXS05_03225 [Planctomycetaceae bacterium]|nr:hypothetical protein [Planctomycetaceae bacterium]
MRFVTAGMVLVLSGGFLAEFGAAQTKKSSSKAPASPALVVVNGQPITEADLDRIMQTRKVPAEVKEKYRRPFLDEMIDARLIRQFLTSKKIVADKKEVDLQVQHIKDVAARRGADPDKAIAEMGYTKESLRDEFALPLAWKKYIEKTLTDEKLQKHFQAHRAEFDGTQVRARQILLKVSSADESNWQAAVEKLTKLRGEITDQKLSFEDAARTHSEAPSKDEGGDVGLFPYSGKMPESFTQEAFKLKVGEISQPFRSEFGVHLCEVTERIPGDLSLEDVRNEVQARMSQELWKKTAADLRKSGKIEWKDKP